MINFYSGQHSYYCGIDLSVTRSALATCKKHNVNPQDWLSDTLARIPTHPHKQVADLLPHH